MFNLHTAVWALGGEACGEPSGMRRATRCNAVPLLFLIPRPPCQVVQIFLNTDTSHVRWKGDAIYENRLKPPSLQRSQLCSIQRIDLLFDVFEAGEEDGVEQEGTSHRNT